MHPPLLTLTPHKLTDVYSVLVVHSDAHRLGHGPLRSHLLRQKIFRTCVIRHSLNPTWDEKLLFHVRAYENAFKVQLTVLDWDTLSSNDYVRDAEFIVADLMADAPQRDERTELYGEEADGGHGMNEFSVPRLSSSRKGAVPWEAKHNPVITFR